ncbi:hypothetical protein CDIK_4139 [Cucumispora dikerogammari]|nr:hypothetical protein CDIK_4139 [Cucumispora dikerogammari]
MHQKRQRTSYKVKLSCKAIFTEAKVCIVSSNSSICIISSAVGINLASSLSLISINLFSLENLSTIKYFLIHGFSLYVMGDSPVNSLNFPRFFKEFNFFISRRFS